MKKKKWMLAAIAVVIMACAVLACVAINKKSVDLPEVASTGNESTVDSDVQSGQDDKPETDMEQTEEKERTTETKASNVGSDTVAEDGNTSFEFETGVLAAQVTTAGDDTDIPKTTAKPTDSVTTNNGSSSNSGIDGGSSSDTAGNNTTTIETEATPKPTTNPTTKPAETTSAATAKPTTASSATATPAPTRPTTTPTATPTPTEPAGSEPDEGDGVIHLPFAPVT